MAVLIDRRELLARARQRGLPLGMVEKDYVLGWVLCGLSRLPGLVFKGGTALAKVYFPETWRLSEDLDFVTAPGAWEGIGDRLCDALPAVAAQSGIGLTVKSRHANPWYEQVRIQYAGPLGRNWVKIDVTPESPIGHVQARSLSQSYSDYPGFTVAVESLEEILSQKLRALVERKKVRDYYDAWRMTELELDRDETARLFPAKLQIKGLTWRGLDDIFPSDLTSILAGYWENELGRLVYPVPEMTVVLQTLRRRLSWLEGLG